MRYTALVIVLICVLLGCTVPTNAATLVDSINVLRSQGCAGSQGTRSKLKRTRELDAVAQEWSKGGRLNGALERAEYRAANSSSMRMSGAPDDRAIIGVLADNYCQTVTDPQFTEIGVQQRGKEIWIVVATPLDLPTVKDAASVAREVLRRVNDARARPRKCGRTKFDGAAPLQLSAMLSRAALAHAQDMARNSHFEHEGTDGSTPAERIARVGYRWKHVAENIAAGAPTAEAVVNGWLNSPGHCANIMGQAYREMGLAYALESKSDAGIYWAQEFGTQR